MNTASKTWGRFWGVAAIVAGLAGLMTIEIIE